MILIYVIKCLKCFKTNITSMHCNSSMFPVNSSVSTDESWSLDEIYTYSLKLWTIICFIRFTSECRCLLLLGATWMGRGLLV